MILLLFASALAARPTSGGAYAFDSTDVVEWVDGPSGSARVFYSVEGPNLVLQGDADDDGVPDFAEQVAETTEAVLTRYAELGFRSIPPDDGVGGSDAMDVYLVDFGGNADGHYSTEGCSGRVCGGYFVMENDFAGYGYPSIETAVRTLTSHELFHGIQAAYDSGEDVWYQEGTAVWAQQEFEPGNTDFLRFCDAFLDDTGRSLDNPPSGPVPTWAYATALWWYFVTERYGDAWMTDYLEATAGDEPLLELLAARTDLPVDWVDFATMNLATGAYAGLVPSYSFAEELGGPAFEDRGDSVDDDQRFYPLATSYYRYEHAGGELHFALAADAPDLVFQLWSTDAEERMQALVAEPASVAGHVSLGEQPAGLYLFFGTNPTLAEDSTKVRVCLGPDAAACAPTAEDTGDTGDTGAEDTAEDTGEAPPGDCGCAGTPGAPGWAWVGVAGLALARRRYSR